jgi:hypothetical protein
VLNRTSPWSCVRYNVVANDHYEDNEERKKVFHSLVLETSAVHSSRQSRDDIEGGGSTEGDYYRDSLSFEQPEMQPDLDRWSTMGYLCSCHVIGMMLALSDYKLRLDAVRPGHIGSL